MPGHLVICAWCKTVLQDGPPDPTPSTSICEPCREKVEGPIDAVNAAAVPPAGRRELSVDELWPLDARD